MAAAARSGAEIRVVTVFAGDPRSGSPAGRWDGRSGFGSAGQAAKARREEDRRACEQIGVEPRWLPFGDHQYSRGGGEQEVYSALEPSIRWSDQILIPGYPLTHDDHVWLSELLCRALPPSARLGFYVEQPYALWRPKGHSQEAAHEVREARSSDWFQLRAGVRARVAKQRAMRCYHSQIELLRRPAWRINRFEVRRGGETAAWAKRAHRALPEAPTGFVVLNPALSGSRAEQTAAR